MLTGKSFRAIRSLSGLSQKELAKAAGTTQATITGYENGRRDIRASTIVRLANEMGVNVVYKIGDTEITGP